MIEGGVDPNDNEIDHGPDDGAWTRIGFDAVLEQQKAIDLAWRDATLANLRVQMAEAGSIRTRRRRRLCPLGRRHVRRNGARPFYFATSSNTWLA